MRQVQASEAKAHLLQLLDEVEQGETLIITRHGRPIARLAPESDRRRLQIEQALAAIRKIRRRTAKISVREILAARDEGRRF